MVFEPAGGVGAWTAGLEVAVLVGSGTFAAWQLTALFVRHALGSATPRP